jgi:hypothetical protein
MTPIYIGPSWAARSYDTYDDTDIEITNIAKELELDVINLATPGYTNYQLLQKLQLHLVKNPDHKNRPIIWFYSDPILDSWWYEDCPMETVIQLKEWRNIRESTNVKILEEFSKLDHPIALIGSHSDVWNCNHPNIEVIHPSWQKFLANECNIRLDIGWCADVAHRFIVSNPQIKPDYDMVDAVSETFGSWRKLEMYNLFQNVHPNIRGNKLFAQEIKQNLFNWLSKFN